MREIAGEGMICGSTRRETAPKARKIGVSALLLEKYHEEAGIRAQMPMRTPLKKPLPFVQKLL
ncbi:hypothetical protein EHI42_21945 [Rhizobium hidalgonense]|uniref:hypothetical protein n=1 Tax=Rhizobium hidalgonense TaxID=1538159 RepID=UPI000FEC9626|nr:hypothetical protein [Rhizobium hidalgonense]RWX12564.1 hypothetical protein EHI42_21945 [Rhizobium hidalgonense]